MANDRIRNLKLDRRLLRRRGWIDAAELEKELADLPDVSDKALLPGEEEPAEEPPGPAGNHPD